MNDSKISKNPEYFSDFKTYNYSNSKKFEDLTVDYFDIGSSYLAGYSKDAFSFNEKNIMLEFLNGFNYEDSCPGSIGMKLEEPSNSEEQLQGKNLTFFEKLKKIGLISEYHWSIYFNKKEFQKEDQAFILLGKLPHEMNSDLGYFKKNNFKDGRLKPVNSKEGNGFELDQTYLFEGSNKENIINESLPIIEKKYIVSLDYTLGGVLLPQTFQEYYNKIFENYIEKGICFNKITYKKSYTFYYCKNDKNSISEIKKIFPGIAMISRDLDYNFTLEAEDLFIEENEYVFCLLQFNQHSYEKTTLYLGKPFLKKYPFSFNYDKREINFYNSFRGDITSGGISVATLIFSILACAIVVSVIFFLIYTFYLSERISRKKRANELGDEEYDYTSKTDEGIINQGNN